MTWQCFCDTENQDLSGTSVLVKLSCTQPATQSAKLTHDPTKSVLDTKKLLK